MKILIVDASWYGGGAETIARELYGHLSKKGHVVKFAFARGDIPTDVDTIKIGSMLDVCIQCAQTRLYDACGFGVDFSTRKFIKDIEVFNPDIISLHNLSGYYLNINTLFKYLSRTNRKVFWTFHDCWAFTGHCLFFDAFSCDKWKSGCGKCPAKKEYPTCLGIERSHANYKKKERLFSKLNNITIVSPSFWMDSFIEQTYLKKYKHYVIPNGIDLQKFHPIYSDVKIINKIQNKKIILGVASRWDLRKGLLYFSKLSQIVNDDKYKIVLVGVDKQQQQELPSNILCIDRTNSVEELIEWYTAADVFVNPTLADNFPTVTLEALACGTPVVTFNTGGSWEAVGEECGELVKLKTTDSLYKAVEKCCDRSISKEICVRKASLYAKEKRYDEYEKLFIESLES